MKMKVAALSVALLSSASAFAPAQQGSRVATSLNAEERSKALPFMKRPPMVSLVFPPWLPESLKVKDWASSGFMGVESLSWNGKYNEKYWSLR